MYKDSIITTQNDFIRATDERIERLDSSYTKMKKKRNRAFIMGGIVSIGTFVLGLFVL